MASLSRIAIALGSNLGDRLSYLTMARNELETCASAGIRSAPIYRTAPVNCPPGSPDFFNTVVEFLTTLSPRELLAKTQEIERVLGRTSSLTRNSPRVVDLDLLFHGDEAFISPELTLPHPRLSSRRFVLQPLADLCPELVLVDQHQSISELLAALDDSEAPLAIAHRVW